MLGGGDHGQKQIPGVSKNGLAFILANLLTWKLQVFCFQVEFEEVLDALGLCEPFLKRVWCLHCQDPEPPRESLLQNSVQQVPDGSGAILGLLKGIRMLE